MLGINLEEEEVAYLADLVQCLVGIWPIKYLGLPLGGNHTRKKFWEPIVTKIAERLDGLKRAFLLASLHLLDRCCVHYQSTFYLSSRCHKE